MANSDERYKVCPLFDSGAAKLNQAVVKLSGAEKYDPPGRTLRSAKASGKNLHDQARYLASRMIAVLL